MTSSGRDGGNRDLQLSARSHLQPLAEHYQFSSVVASIFFSVNDTPISELVLDQDRQHFLQAKIKHSLRTLSYHQTCSVDIEMLLGVDFRNANHRKSSNRNAISTTTMNTDHLGCYLCIWTVLCEPLTIKTVNARDIRNACVEITFEGVKRSCKITAITSPLVDVHTILAIRKYI